MRPLMVFNFVQPWIRVFNSYASVDIRRRTVFGPGFYCYGGSFFCTLRAECARYSGAHWARKVDLDKDARLFDLLDQRIRPGAVRARRQLQMSGDWELLPT